LIKYTEPLGQVQALRIVGRVSLPLVLARLVSALNGFAGMLMMAQLGREALAAGALITAAFNTLMVIVWGMMFSVGVMIGHAHGAHEHRKIGQIMRASVLLSILISIPVSILMWNLPPIFLWLHQPRQEVLLAREYFHPAAFVVLPSLICVCFSQLAMAINHLRLVLILSIASLVVSILLTYGFLFGDWGFPHLGVAGIAWANVIVWTLSFIIVGLYFILHKRFRHYHLLHIDLKPLVPLMRRMIKLGTPISVQFGGELAALGAMTLLMGLFGGQALAAQQIVVQIGLLVVMIPLGISQAAAVLISQAMGAKKYFVLRRLASASLGLGIIVMLLVAVIYWIFPHALIWLYMRGFHADIHVKHLAVLLFAILAVSQFFDAFRNIITGALRGLHDTQKAMKVGIISVWVIAIPVGAFAAFVLKLGPIGLPLGFVVGFAYASWVLFRRYQRLSRQLVKDGALSEGAHE
jgi:multidrug resistance protein, MATE family